MNRPEAHLKLIAPRPTGRASDASTSGSATHDPCPGTVRSLPSARRAATALVNRGRRDVRLCREIGDGGESHARRVRTGVDPAAQPSATRGHTGLPPTEAPFFSRTCTCACHKG
ncbi:hypothetical protein SUDANB37_02005 [Streptomyces sp. enrichment culture]